MGTPTAAAEPPVSAVRYLAEVPSSVRAHARYFAAVTITVLAIASQYFVPQLVPALFSTYNWLPTGLLIVYGIPIAAFLLLVGTGPLHGWKDQMGEAAIQGVRWYGVLSLEAIFVAVFLVLLLTAIGQNPLNALQRETPVIKAAVTNPWFWVAFSFVIGA
ncbi:MAG: hypothetical protein L3J81_06370, partial [Thermoplasmata archaeon]|nr:hypothetical protein [Thermoplasmata archaeon]